ncbi:unnamed protein product [Notodromas monacha]|uniref:Tetraspanin n=1 Tax=Notodromas monacha TaxID=399045 RepID=A0A7R9C0I0_9CRUS|nr:unnamed protein product [Notodromas monacha]CAG0924225.1 unnamed protein product [Notodromas monacha]
MFLLQWEAMRYYRLWIYACNAVLLASALVLLAYATLVSADYRLAFIPHSSLLHPSLVYAYLALLAQSGCVQALGCYAAVKLDPRLLRAYWAVLLVLLLGDVATGLVWVFRYDRICRDLVPELKRRLVAEYGMDPGFTRAWDRLQVEARCCGADGPEDFNLTDAFNDGGGGVGGGGGYFMSVHVPATCCHPSHALPVRALANAEPESGGSGGGGGVPSFSSSSSSSSSTSVGNTAAAAAASERAKRSNHRDRHWQPPPTKPSPKLPQKLGQKPGPGKRQRNLNVTCVDADLAPRAEAHELACGQVLKKWVGDAAEVLFVLGFCVIAFSKICFLGLLRYEIKEMIQKIKMLRCEEAAAAAAGGGLGHDYADITQNHVSHQQQLLLHQAPPVSSSMAGECPSDSACGEEAATPCQQLEEQDEALLQRPTPVHTRLNHLNPNYDSASEHSNAALIPLLGGGTAGGGQEAHEMDDLAQASAGPGRQTEI